MKLEFIFTRTYNALQGKSSLHLSINDIVIIDEKVNHVDVGGWLKESKDKNVRSTKVVIGKIKNTVTRLITCLYPVEFCEEFSPTVKNEVERRRSKTGRNTAVIVHLKKKIINARRVSVNEVTCHSI